MAKYYQPPFKMSDEIVGLLIEIGEYVGRLTVWERTYAAEKITGINVGKMRSDSMEDMLTVYRMSEETDKEGAVFRTKGAGIYADGRLVHTAVPPQYVKRRMEELFTWMHMTAMHPLLKACIFYYEYIFIHPFAGNNDEIGQFWFLLILREWRPFLGEMPIGRLLSEQPEQYYQAVRASKNGDSAVFAAYLLKMIRDVLKDNAASLGTAGRNVGIKANGDVGTKGGAHVSYNDEKVLRLLSENPKITAKGLAGEIGLTDRQIERILAKLKKEGRIERIGASKNGCWKVHFTACEV